MNPHTKDQDAKPPPPPIAPVNLLHAVEYSAGAIVSKSLADTSTGTITAFAFDQGQSLSEHSAPFDAHVLVLDGLARLTIGGQVVKAAAGEWLRLPANIPHAVYAPGPFKMLLIMLKH
jgi:quercetin dioxygenase-like cupin family protein